MQEKFWQKKTQLTALAALVYVALATGIGALIMGH